MTRAVTQREVVGNTVKDKVTDSRGMGENSELFSPGWCLYFWLISYKLIRCFHDTLLGVINLQERLTGLTRSPVYYEKI